MLKILLTLAISLLLTTTVYASPQSYYYYTHNDDLNQVSFEFIGNFKEEEKLEFLLNQLLTSDRNYVPLGTKILDVRINKNYAELNFSRDLLRYGGIFYEDRLINQIIKTALEFPDINFATILVEGELINLNEGTEIFAYNHIIDL